MPNDDSIRFDRKKEQFVGLTDQIKKELSDTYKGVDIEAELIKMHKWLLSTKGERRKGTIGFIINWLNNAKPQKLTVDEARDLMKSDTQLGVLLHEYLKDLWKDREHLLEFNTIRR